MRSKLFAALLYILSFMLVVMGLLWLILPNFVVSYGRGYLQDFGIEDANFEALKIGPNRSILSSFEASGIEVRNANISYNIWEAIRGEIAELNISYVEISFENMGLGGEDDGSIEPNVILEKLRHELFSSYDNCQKIPFDRAIIGAVSLPDYGVELRDVLFTKTADNCSFSLDGDGNNLLVQVVADEINMTVSLGENSYGDYEVSDANIEISYEKETEHIEITSFLGGQIQRQLEGFNIAESYLANIIIKSNLAELAIGEEGGDLFSFWQDSNLEADISVEFGGGDRLETQLQTGVDGHVDIMAEIADIGRYIREGGGMVAGEADIEAHIIHDENGGNRGWLGAFEIGLNGAEYEGIAGEIDAKIMGGMVYNDNQIAVSFLPSSFVMADLDDGLLPPQLLTDNGLTPSYIRVIPVNDTMAFAFDMDSGDMVLSGGVEISLADDKGSDADFTLELQDVVRNNLIWQIGVIGVEISDMEYDGVEIDSFVFDGGLEGGQFGEVKGLNGEWSGELNAAAGVLDDYSGEWRVDDLRIAGGGEINYDEGHIFVNNDDCINIDVSKISKHDGRIILNISEPFCILSGAENLLVVNDDFSDLEIRADINDISGSVISADNNIDFEFPEIAAHFLLEPQMLLELNGDGGKVSSDRYLISMENLSHDFKLDGDELNLSLESSRLLDGHNPLYFNPLRASLNVVGDVRNQLDFSGRIFNLSSIFSLNFEGSHDMSAGRGAVEWEIPVINFIAGLREPQSYFPVVASYLDVFSGKIGAEGELSWANQQDLSGRASLLLDDVKMENEDYYFEGVNAVLNVSELFPLTMPEGQKIYIGLMDLGFPLIGGEIDFGLAEQNLILENAAWNWSGGKISASSAEIPLDGGAADILLEVDNISLSDVIELVDLEGLSGEGQLRGNLPIHIEDGEFSIIDGVLSSIDGGHISYGGGEAESLASGGGGTQTLIEVLSNLDYNEMQLDINGAVGSEQEVQFKINGNNPDYYDGYPVALNVTLQGALDTVIRRGLGAYNLPSNISEAIEGFRSQKSEVGNH